MSAEVVTVPLWKLRRAIEVLEKDGDEHGVAADLRAAISAGVPAFQAVKPAWTGPGPEPSKWWDNGVLVYRSYADYCMD